MAKVLITEEIAEIGLNVLRDAGFEVDIQPSLSHEQLLSAVVGANAVIIRSATKITADVLKMATSLKVIGRAGIGLDNVDVKAATAQGVMVVNAPQSNIISAAEHAIALLLAQARNIPQANEALKAGRWERSQWEGVELFGKTLGIAGLGRIGTLVAQRMNGFGMRLIAYDPYITSERAKQLNCELVSLQDLIQEADFLTIHLPKTPETTGLINKDLLSRSKPGLRLINAARGGIVDEEALAFAIDHGQINGAGLDVFDQEPTTSSPLFKLPSVVVTPHLGASTSEAQDKAGITIAEQVVLALSGEFVPLAVNIDAAEVSEPVKPFLNLAETLGGMFSCLTHGQALKINVNYQGAIAEHDTRILTLAVLKGFYYSLLDEPVSYVNAPQIANERGMEIQEQKSAIAPKYVSTLSISNDDHLISGTITLHDNRRRIVAIDGFDVEVPPAQNMLVVRNDDTPGKVGAVGTALAQANINITDMALGRAPDYKSALMVIATDQPVDKEVLLQISKVQGINAVDVLSK